MTRFERSGTNNLSFGDQDFTLSSIYCVQHSLFQYMSKSEYIGREISKI